MSTRPQKVMVCIGTRPEAIKMAPVVRALKQTEGVVPLVVSTGQHRELLADALSAFDFTLDAELDVMVPNQSLAGLTSRLIERLDRAMDELSPDFVLVQGDTTTTFAAGLAAFYRQIPVGHIEAGLRSGDKYSPFPEEVNRTLVTHMAALHFAPTEEAKAHLLREGVSDETVAVTGNTVVDALEWQVARQRASEGKSVRLLAEQLGDDWQQRPYVLVTTHRRENFGRGLENICGALRELAAAFQEMRFVLPMHLNPRVSGPVQEELQAVGNVSLIAPQPYQEFVALLESCHMVLTDSGGIQEEAPALGKPVLVMRENTERPEGITAGTVKLVGTERADIVRETTRLLSDEAAFRAMAQAVNPYGDGKAAPRITARVAGFLATRKRTVARAG